MLGEPETPVDVVVAVVGLVSQDSGVPYLIPRVPRHHLSGNCEYIAGWADGWMTIIIMVQSKYLLVL